MTLPRPASQVPLFATGGGAGGWRGACGGSVGIPCGSSKYRDGTPYSQGEEARITLDWPVDSRGATIQALFRPQRPWHFLYFWPEPHQQTSLRPIRSPDGVYPGRGPPAGVAPLPGPPSGWSPSDSRIFRASGPVTGPVASAALPAPPADGPAGA